MLEFVRYSCGCVGLHSETSDICLLSCDGEGVHTFHVTDRLHGKKFEPLPWSEIQPLAKELDRLLADGQKFRTVRNLFS